MVQTLQRNTVERVKPISPSPERHRVAPWADKPFSVLAHGAAWLTLVLFFITFVVLTLSKLLLSQLRKGEGACA